MVTMRVASGPKTMDIDASDALCIWNCVAEYLAEVCVRVSIILIISDLLLFSVPFHQDLLKSAD